MIRIRSMHILADYFCVIIYLCRKSDWVNIFAKKIKTGLEFKKFIKISITNVNEKIKKGSLHTHTNFHLPDSHMV